MAIKPGSRVTEMLERTAASIEPCRFQRVLPSSTSKYSLKNRRHLHPSFWQHAAPNVELLDACSALMRVPLPDTASALIATKSESNKLEPSLASTLVLDFLYPNGAATLLRRLRATPTPLQPFTGDRKPTALTTRLYTSSSGHDLDNSASTEKTEESNTTATTGAVVPDQTEMADQSGQTAERRFLSGVEALREVLTSEDDVKAPERAWSLYNDLEDSEKKEFRTHILLYLTQSARPVEAWRVCELFSLYTVDEWTNDLVEAAIRARLMFQDISAAKVLFTTALEKRKLGRGLEPFVVYCFRTSNWPLFFDVWALFEANMPASAEWFVFGFNILPALPEFAEKLMALYRFAKNKDRRSTRPPLRGAAPLTVGGLAEAASRELMEQDVIQSTDRELTQAANKGLAEPMEQQLTQTANQESAQITEEDLVEAKAQELVPPTDQELAQPTVQEQDQNTNQEPANAEFRNRVQSFLNLLARNSSSSFSPTAAATILRYSHDPATHEIFVHSCIERGWDRLAVDIYDKFRRLPGLVLEDHKDVMRAVLELHYRRKDPVGMQRLLEDWRATGWMPMKVYQRLIVFYSREGDEVTVKQLIKDYLRDYRLARLDETVVWALIQVHAANGDPEGARRVIDEHVAISGMPPSNLSWRLLLQSYMKKRDFEGAMGAFTRYCEEGQPDQQAFGIIMLMAGGRGDLRMTLDLLQLSADMGVKPNIAMMDAVVEAYCQNERFEEAAMLCARTTKDASIEGSRTVLWNTLLRHHARQRDLTSVNRVLEYMTKNNVPYDSRTYTCLLRALVYCKQAHHALHFIQVALKDGIFEPTEDHYVLLMSAFIRTGEKHLALKTGEALDRRFPQTGKRLTAVIRALGSLGFPSPRPVDVEARRWGGDAIHYVNRALWKFREALVLDGGKIKANHQVTAGLYSQIIFFLIQLRDIASVRDILSLYSLQFPDRATEDNIPMKLLLDMMLAEFTDGNYDRVKEIFDIVVNRLEKIGKPARLNTDNTTQPGWPGEPKQSNQAVSNGLVPVVQYELCDALKTMQRMYVATEDAEGLMNMMKDVRRKGFKLDSKNWNYYVQALARLNRWEEAFKVCERELMPAWTGWQSQRTMRGAKRQLPREILRLGDNPRRPRPISYTMLVLVKVWNELDQLTVWSAEASRMMEKIKRSCPRAVKAVTSPRGEDIRSTPNRQYKVLRWGLRGRTVEEKAQRKMGWVKRLGWQDIEEPDYDDIEEQPFVEEEQDSTPQASYTKKPIADVKTPYPWRQAWANEQGLQLGDGEGTVVADHFRVLKERTSRRKEQELRESTALYGARPPISGDWLPRSFYTNLFPRGDILTLRRGRYHSPGTEHTDVPSGSDTKLTNAESVVNQGLEALTLEPSRMRKSRPRSEPASSSADKKDGIAHVVAAREEALGELSKLLAAQDPNPEDTTRSTAEPPRPMGRKAKVKAKASYRDEWEGSGEGDSFSELERMVGDQEGLPKLRRRKSNAKAKAKASRRDEWESTSGSGENNAFSELEKMMEEQSPRKKGKSNGDSKASF